MSRIPKKVTIYPGESPIITKWSKLSPEKKREIKKALKQMWIDSKMPPFKETEKVVVSGWAKGKKK